MNDYQDFTRTTAIYPKIKAKEYTLLGLSGEVGEVCIAAKKEIRDNAPPSPNMTKELGDVLWYLARVADEYGITLENVAQRNIAKLSQRKDRGTIGGSGDDR